jgi:hypothetical protein
MRMFRSAFRPGCLTLVASLGLLAACKDDGADTAPSQDGDMAAPPPAPPPTVDPGGPTAPSSRKFEVTIENVSGDSSLTTPFSPGVYAVHGAGFSLFTDGAADRGEGLERIGEDGNPATLGAALLANGSLMSKGIFDTPAGDEKKGPATPGKKFVFTVDASAASPNLSFATMYGQSNDWFFAPGAAGVPLFDAAGQPLPERDVTDLISVWNVGSEVDQMPGMGPDQGPRQAAPNTGALEGVLAPYTDSTRAFPGALKIAKVTVAATDDGGFAITVNNISGPTSSIVTGISPVFYAVHDASWALFQDGVAATPGLEHLAEDGNAGALATEHMGANGTSVVGAATIRDGASAPGGAPPGGSFTFRVKPDANHRYLSIASMVGESNDAFLAFSKSGVALLDEAGAPRPLADITDDFARQLTVWDAGTEANEVPGVGLNQGPRQSGPNTGPADPKPGVRRYADATNDLAGAAGGVINVHVEAGSDAGHLTVVVTNASGSTAFPGRASPLVWAVHTGNHVFFTPGKASPAGIEHLAEDGNPLAWNAGLDGLEDVAAHGIVNTPDGSDSTGPIVAGASYTFSIPVGANAKYFDFAQMWTPSNDTFLSLGTKGVSLLDGTGAVRPLAAINADLGMLVSAWDAGTEQNQPGALGPDQAPRQAAQNTGAPEGNGLVRQVSAMWGVPAVRHLVRVHVKPL